MQHVSFSFQPTFQLVQLFVGGRVVTTVAPVKDVEGVPVGPVPTLLQLYPFGGLEQLHKRPVHIVIIMSLKVTSYTNISVFPCSLQDNPEIVSLP